MTKTIHFNGPCPFLTCLEEGPHSHPICPDCEAVKYGNLFCPTCRQYWLTNHTETIRHLREAIEAHQEASTRPPISPPGGDP